MLKTHTSHNILNPVGGTIALWGIKDAAVLAHLALYDLQPRGTETAGIVSSDGTKLHRFTALGHVVDQFERDVFQILPGSAAVGRIGYLGNRQPINDNVGPLLFEDHSGPLAITSLGVLTNYQAVKSFLIRRGAIFRTDYQTELVLHLLAHTYTGTVAERLLTINRMIEGAFSIVILTADSLFVLTDGQGFFPLCLGKKDDGWVVASESCAFDLIGAEFVRELQPGELTVINKDGCQSVPFVKSSVQSRCCLEAVHFCRPESRFGSSSYGQISRKLGSMLGEKYPVPQADIVMAVPDSAMGMAIGYAQATGKPFEPILLNTTPVRGEVITADGTAMDVSVKVNFKPMTEYVRDKSVVLVDDVLADSKTMNLLVSALKRGGAREVHIRISAPPIQHPCRYGVIFPLPTDHKKDLDSADSLEFLSMDEVFAVLSESMEQSYCTACITGHYPFVPGERYRTVRVAD